MAHIQLKWSWVLLVCALFGNYMLSQSFSANGEGKGGPLQGKLQPDRAVSVQIKSITRWFESISELCPYSSVLYFQHLITGPSQPSDAWEQMEGNAGHARYRVM